MIPLLRSFTLLLTACFIGFTARASHIYGADFFYEHMGGNNYKVSLVLYGDCSGSSFPSLPASTPQINLYDGSSMVKTFSLARVGEGVEVTPVCPSEQNNTTCKGGTIPGVTRYIYSAITTVDFPSANWRFRFTGSMGASTSAGRSNSITSIFISGTGGSVMVLDAELNNTAGPNSSPQFTTIPTPFYCINVPQQYNQGSVDVNNDSLVYSLAPALEGATTVNYNFGYSPTVPVITANGGFTFSPVSGQMNFTPSITQKALVVNKVTEYKNGIQVGSATREMTFVVLASCTSNQPATGTANNNTINGAVLDGTTLNVCEGTPHVQFSINASDPDGDTVNVTVNGVPSGATAAIANNNTPHPVINFNWNAATAAPGNYNIFLTYKDNGCPFSSQQTQAYTVRVVRPNSISAHIIAPTQCVHKALVSYTLSNGLLPRSVVIKKGAVTVSSFTDSTGVVTDSLGEGSYVITITSPKLSCPTFVNLTVNDSGRYPHPPAIATSYYCKDDVPMAIIATPDSGAVVKWFDAAGNFLPAAPVPSTNTAGIFRQYFASQYYKVCESIKDTATVYVTQRPTADFTLSPTVLCTVDTATILFTGAIGVGPIIDYKWGWDGANYAKGNDAGPWKVKWNNAGTKVITLQVLENKCPSDTMQHTLLVKPTPVAAFTTKNICQYDTMQVSYTADPLMGQQYAWNFDGAQFAASNLPGPFQLHWANPGTKHLSLTVSLDGCVDTVSYSPTVFLAPLAQILNIPGTVCLGDKIYLQATGGGTYQWLPKNKLSYELDGRLYTRVSTPTTYTVIVKNEFNCVDSDAITYNNIEPCCQFSYPNAFTPNGDGRNDIFRIRLYGNQENYALSIYNRWGQRVYYSADPSSGWDGRLNDKPCDAGTYFYMLKATCLTGHLEEQKGELQLIR